MNAQPQTHIDRRQGVALWRQIADAIRNQASQGLADDTGRLPPEQALADRFDCNRHTVRAAIRALVDEGVLRAEQGRGTFLQDVRRLTYPISRRTRFSEGLGSQTHTIERNLLASELEPATPAIAKELQLQSGDTVWRLETLSKADGKPVSRATTWFDAARFSDIAASFQAHGSVTKALKDHGVDDYQRASTAVEATLAQGADLDALGLSPGAVVLVTRSVNVDMDGRPIEHAITRFAADRVTLNIIDSQAPSPDRQD
ncbi:MAG: phosphonate metabolism transcriptional regulator PhnF [Pseudomonadota bacterium]